MQCRKPVMHEDVSLMIGSEFLQSIAAIHHVDVVVGVKRDPHRPQELARINTFVSKFALLPNGEVIPYSHFFTPSLSVKDIMKEAIAKEGKPLTDNDLQERLKSQGIHIARRTVSKYRIQLDILPSALR
jgi:hypothetical protein